MVYHLSFGKLLRKNSLDPVKESKKKKPQSKGYFCSELIAAAYKHVKLIDKKLASSQYWPGTFSSEKNLKLLNGASLHRERSVVLIRHIK